MMTVSPANSTTTTSDARGNDKSARPPEHRAPHYMSRSQDILPVVHAKTDTSDECIEPLQHSMSMTQQARPLSAAGAHHKHKMHSVSTLSVNNDKAGALQPQPPVKEPLLPHRALKINPLTSSKPAVRRVADMRINRTKSTVTELQKERNEMQAHVVDLSRRVDAKQTEIQQLRIELKRERAHAAPSSDTVDARPRSALPNASHTEYVDAATSPVPPDSTPDDMDSFASTPPPAADHPSVLTACAEEDRWERLSMCSEVSLACLQDRIVEMQETHFSTTEELQATLAELTELQDIVDDLYNDNQRLTDERNMFDEVAQTQHKKIENLRLQVENMKYLLLTGYESIVSRQRDAVLITEREHKLFEALQTAHREQNDLKFVYMECIAELQSAREDGQRHEHMCTALRTRLQQDTRHNEVTRSDGGCAHCSTLQADCALLQSQLMAQCTRDEHIADMRSTITSLSQSLQSALAERDTLLTSEHAGVVDEQTMTSESAESLRTAVDALHMENGQLHSRIGVMQRTFDEEHADWRQFQSDLLTAVSVANDFKTEAQVDIERIGDELRSLRDTHSRTLDELTLMRQQAQRAQHMAGKQGGLHPNTNLPMPTSCTRVTSQPCVSRAMSATPIVVSRTTALVSASTAASGEDIKSRIDAYLAAVSPVASLVDSTTIGRLPSKRTPVKAVVSELNEASSSVTKALPPTSPRKTLFVAPPCKMRLNFATGASSSGKSPSAIAELSKSNMNLASSLNAGSAANETYKSVHSMINATTSSSTLPSARTLKPARSDTNVQQSSTRAASCLTTPNRGATVDHLSTSPSPSVVQDVSPKAPPTPPVKPSSALVKRGILTSKTDTELRKSSAYLMEAGDPLAHLMKDAPRGSRRNALLKWVKDRTCGYVDVDVTNFSSCWNDGLAFCALFHTIVPERMPFNSLSANNKRDNFTRAFECGASLGIVDDTLCAEELVALERPDWQAVMAYVTQVYAVAQRHE